MSLIFDKIFEFGYHDTELTFLDNEEMMLKLYFGNGLYNLDAQGVELDLSKPIILCLKINPKFKCVDNIIEIIDLSGKKDTYIEYKNFKKLLKKDSCPICNLYFSGFNETILIDCSLRTKRIQITIEGIEEVSFLY
ncbi:MAG: hypothetical protein K2H02_05665 [Anaeroplasmataceae bacterium]|nr:hypothetical protein [Anaeroplasmataceae bacterium]MDE5868414.1 hypothetical protein [Anaeroplasmataceae bacterium]